MGNTAIQTCTATRSTPPWKTHLSAQRIKLHRQPLDEADLSSAIDHLEGAEAEESLELSPAQCIQEADDTACQAQLDLINAQVRAHMEGKLIQNLAVIGES